MSTTVKKKPSTSLQVGDLFVVAQGVTSYNYRVKSCNRRATEPVYRTVFKVTKRDLLTDWDSSKYTRIAGETMKGLHIISLHLTDCIKLNGITHLKLPTRKR